MKIERECKTCGSSFFAIKLKQQYCSKSCFKIDYARKKNLDKTGRFPTYTCKVCGNSIELSFDPLVEHIFWDDFKCPKCFPELQNQIAIIITSKTVFIAF